MKFITKLILPFIIISSQAQAQLPPPVDLQIQNITQETHVWCWAAVAQQIIFRLKGPSQTPPQCVLVSTAFNIPPGYCCQFPSPCMSTGSLQQIQALIAFYGGSWSSIAQPTNPVTIYRTLASGRAIIMAVQSSPYSGHVVVLRGMAWVSTPFGVKPVLYINDPMAYFTQPVPFETISSYWGAAIVVH